MNTPVGYWRMNFYDDTSPNLTKTATQRICFRANGTWYSTTYPNWGGFWFQKGANPAGNGDRVRVFGNYAKGDGNDSGELDFVSRKLMTGPWTEWRDPGSCTYRYPARVTFLRISKRCPKALIATARSKTAVQRLAKREPTGRVAKKTKKK